MSSYVKTNLQRDWSGQRFSKTLFKFGSNNFVVCFFNEFHHSNSWHQTELLAIKPIIININKNIIKCHYHLWGMARVRLGRCLELVLVMLSTPLFIITNKICYISGVARLEVNEGRVPIFVYAKESHNNKLFCVDIFLIVI